MPLSFTGRWVVDCCDVQASELAGDAESPRCNDDVWTVLTNCLLARFSATLDVSGCGLPATSCSVTSSIDWRNLTVCGKRSAATGDWHSGIMERWLDNIPSDAVAAKLCPRAPTSPLWDGDNTAMEQPTSQTKWGWQEQTRLPPILLIYQLLKTDTQEMKIHTAVIIAIFKVHLVSWPTKSGDF